MTYARGERALYSIALVAFLICAAVTLWMAHDMAGGMPMPGGWTMSMAWMPMQGQGWLGATGMFLAMWLAMMVAMMLPSMLPMLLLYRAVLRREAAHAIARRTWLAAGGYFAVWLGFGALAWMLGAALAQGAMHSDTISRAVPWATIAALALAGVWQLTRWKATCLAHCRNPLGWLAAQHRPGDAGAWRLGAHHGLYCAGCCWGLMVVQLAFGVMSLSLMVAIATWIALEKLTPLGPQLARVGGYAALLSAVGLVLLW